MKKFSALLIAVALSITMFAVTSTSVNAVPVVVINGDYKIELHNVAYDSGTNLQTWTYNVSCINSPGISHIVFEFKEICDPPLSVIYAAGPTSVEWSEDYGDGLEPTGIVGIKFDGLELEPGEWMLVWFTLEGEWPVGTIEVWVKAGSEVSGSGVVASGIVDGPECMPDNRIPEVPFGSVMAGASMLVAFVAYAIVRKRK